MVERVSQVNLIGDERPLGVIIGKEAALFDNIDVKTLPLPVRALHRLPAKEINTIGDLLRHSPAEIMKIKGLGSNTVLAVFNYLSELDDGMPQIVPQSIEYVNLEPVSNLAEDKRPIGMILGMEAQYFEHLDVSTLPLPVRAINRLPENNINTVGDLLRHSPAEMMAIKGMGFTTISSIFDYLSSLDNELSQQVSKPEVEIKNLEQADVPTSCRNARIIAKKYGYKIACGDFSCFDTINLTDNDTEYIKAIKRAYDDLGEEYAFQAVVAPEMTEPIRYALLSFIYESSIQKKNFKEIEDKYLRIPLNRRTQPAIYYIRAFSRDENKRKELMRLYREGDTLDDYYHRITCANTSDINVFSSFFSWLSFDIETDLNALIQKVFVKPNDAEVVRLRGNKKTLQEVGKVMGVTRERVRQIEARVLRKFIYQYSRVRLLSKICAIREGDTVLTPVELTEYFGDHTAELVYLLSKVDNPTDYIYEKQTGSFIVGSLSQAECLGDAMDSLPEVFHDEEAEKIISSACEEYDISRELLWRAVEDSFKHTGNTYHRTRLTRGVVYKTILEKYYPDGMRVYDPEEISRFRKYAIDEYGIDDLPENDRAITARITNISILSGRGIYRPKKDHYFSSELESRIVQYINDQQRGIVPTAAIYSRFEDELRKEGIDNRYYLQGILRERLGEKLLFKRDYILKDPSISSVYDEIIKYIRSSPVLVSKKELFHSFKVSEITIQIAVSDPSIINYFGAYLHGSHLSITSEEKQTLGYYLANLLSDHAEHHIQAIYDELKDDQSSFCGRNGIFFPYQLFSVLQYLFGDIFQFSRPFIAENDVVIGRAEERIKELVLGSDEIELDELYDFAKENHYWIYSKLDFINGFSDTHVFKNRDELIRISETDITEADIPAIEEMILAEIDGHNKLIGELECVHRFRKLNIPWNEWFLYSILRKWSSKLEVGNTGSQLRYAAPVVAPVGSLNVEAFDYASAMRASIGQLDDLNKLDELIADYIIEDDEW